MMVRKKSKFVIVFIITLLVCLLGKNNIYSQQNYKFGLHEYHNDGGINTLYVGNSGNKAKDKSEFESFITYDIVNDDAPSTINDLSEITIDGIPILGFEKDILEYTLDEVDYTSTSIIIGAVTENENSTLEGVGLKYLDVGSNSFEIIVTSQSGIVKIYKINVVRKKNNDANLQLLSVKGYDLDPNFSSDIYDYTIEVPTTKNVLVTTEVTATPVDSNAKVVKDVAIGLSSTTENIYKITVTAADGITTNTYRLHIIKTISDDAFLSDVTLSAGTLEEKFDKNKKVYTIRIPEDIDEFEILASASYPSTKVIGNGKYKITDGPITILTQAQSGKTDSYTFNIVQALSDDASLSNLSVRGYPLNVNFQPTTKSYDIGNIPYGTDQLMIIAVTLNNNSTLEYYVDEVKQTGMIVDIPQTPGTNSIIVKVIAENGVDYKDYNVTYTMEDIDNANLSKLEPSVGKISLSENKYNYELTVENKETSVAFNIETEKKNSTINIDGKTYSTPKAYTVNNLSVGNTTLTIQVVSQSGKTTNTYNVVIKRLPRKLSNDAYLNSLSIEKYSFTEKFVKDKFLYDIGTIPYSEEKMIINSIAFSEAAKINYYVNGVKQKSNNLILPKNEGKGEIIVQVVAEDGKTINNYKIEYNKDASKTMSQVQENASIATLSMINPVGYSLTPSFNKEVLNYEVFVGSSTTTLDFEIIKTNEKETISTILKSLGNNKYRLDLKSLKDESVKITVNSENGESIQVYTINIKRNLSSKSEETSLENIEIEGYKLEPNFDPNILNYRIEVESNITELNIIAKTLYTDSKVEIIGNKDFKDGENIVTITVTDKNGNIKKYQISVNKEQDSKMMLGTNRRSMMLITILFTIMLLWFIFLLFKRKKDEEDK